MVSLLKVINILNKLASPKLADPKDEIGLQVGSKIKESQENKLVKNIIVSLDPTLDTIQTAVDLKAQLIITHHPLIWGSIKSLSEELLQKIRMLTSSYLNLFVIHTNWDCAENGTNDTLIDLLGLLKTGTFSIEFANNLDLPIGRLCKPAGNLMTLKLLLEIIQDKTKSQNIVYCGDIESEVNKIVMVVGGGGDINFLEKAVSLGVDTFITGTASYHSFLYAKENNLKLVAAGHFETENPGMKRLSQILQMELPEVKIKFYDSKPPEKYLKPI